MNYTTRQTLALIDDDDDDGDDDYDDEVIEDLWQYLLLEIESCCPNDKVP